MRERATKVRSKPVNSKMDKAILAITDRDNACRFTTGDSCGTPIAEGSLVPALVGRAFVAAGLHQRELRGPRRERARAQNPERRRCRAGTSIAEASLVSALVGSGERLSLDRERDVLLERRRAARAKRALWPPRGSLSPRLRLMDCGRATGSSASWESVRRSRSSSKVSIRGPRRERARNPERRRCRAPNVWARQSRKGHWFQRSLGERLSLDRERDVLLERRRAARAKRAL